MDFDFSAIMDAHISPYTVGFVLLHGPNLAPLGSGTLVRCRSTQGILTCGHVLAALPTSEDFGVAQFGLPEARDQRMRLSGSVTTAHAVKFFEPPGSRDGPDIAFIPVPAVEFSSLAARGSVIDLDLEQRKAASGRPEAVEALEAVSGVVGQRTPAATTEGTKSTLSVAGLICPGGVVSAPTVGQWDQLHFKPQPHAESSLPTDFGGMSGGGMWRIYLKKAESGEYKPVETRLTGVAYWQDDIQGSLGVVGHGPISIYGHLLDQIYRRWPPEQ